MNNNIVKLTPMTDEMYHSYFREYENDPDLCMSEQECLCYEYSEEMVERYIQIQREWKRVTLAILCKDEIVGEIILKNIEEHKCATMSITLKNPTFKDRGIGTAAEKLAVDYVFREMNIPTLYADTIQSNTRSQRVLKKSVLSLLGRTRLINTIELTDQCCDNMSGFFTIHTKTISNRRCFPSLG